MGCCYNSKIAGDVDKELRDAFLREEQNMMLYGVCQECGRARIRGAETREEGDLIVNEVFLTCPNGHHYD
jgi:hypothetical protein